MPRKITDGMIRDAQRLNIEGRTLVSIGKEFGVNPDNLSKAMRKAGIEVVKHKRPPPNTLDLPVDEIASMYQNGYSENAIAIHFNVARNAIRRRLMESGITPRTQGEAELLKWAQMSEEDRANQVKSAHKSTKGVPLTEAHKVAIAKAREKAVADWHIGAGEPEFKEFLSRNGIPFVYQKAVYSYNLDFCIGSVAVELTAFAGRFGNSRENMSKRAKNLLERGYKTLGVEFDSVSALMSCAEDIVSIAYQMDRLESIDSEYWVVRCRRHNTPILKSDVDESTVIVTPVEHVIKRSTIKLG